MKPKRWRTLAIGPRAVNWLPVAVFNPKRKVRVKNQGLGTGHKLLPPVKGLPCNTRAAFAGFASCSARGIQVMGHVWSQLSFLLTHLSPPPTAVRGHWDLLCTDSPHHLRAVPRGMRTQAAEPLTALNKHCISLNH